MKIAFGEQTLPKNRRKNRLRISLVSCILLAGQMLFNDPNSQID